MNEPQRNEFHESNRAAWNEGAEAYEAGLSESIAFLKAGGQNFCPPELEFLQDLDKWCERAIHLQCAGGADTISLWNRGAKEVIGVDISDRMIEVAKAKSKAVGANANWIRSDILQTPVELNGTADLVYTGRGAICWIMDLEAWAKVIARLLKPGGSFYLFEGHPFSEMWTLEDETYVLDPEYGDYFKTESIVSNDWPDTYIGDLGRPEVELAKKYERIWGVGQIINALIDAGLTIKRVGEHPNLFWDRFPNMSPELVKKLPQTLSILAVKDDCCIMEL